MAFKLLDLSQVKDYVSRFDPNHDNPTIWKLGVLDAFQWADIQDASTISILDDDQSPEVTPAINLARRMLLMVRYGLKGVENLPEPDFRTQTIVRRGKERQVVDEDFLAVLPSDLIVELATEIHNLTTSRPQPSPAPITSDAAANVVAAAGAD